MKELINIVNSKIQAVIDELKNQKITLEQKLKSVETEIEKKVDAAAICKNNVEQADNTISILNTDIEKLKKDLQDLHDKFDSAGFTELLEAGNKEINGKIIENNTKISEEQEAIRRFSEEAQNIKDELEVLKQSKTNLETDLNNTIVALKYYSKKIDDMTITAIENADKLSDIVILDDENNEIVDVDVNKVIDGTIFDEIEHISSNDRELSEQELEEILNAKTSFDKKEEELSQTQALDTAILQTNDYVEEAPVAPTAPVEEVQSVEPVETFIPQEPVQEEIVQEPIQQEIVQEPIQQEIVQEPIQQEIVQEPIQQEIVQEPVMEQVPYEPVQTDVAMEPVVEPQMEQIENIQEPVQPIVNEYDNQNTEILDSIPNEVVPEEVSAPVEPMDININVEPQEPVENTFAEQTVENANELAELGLDPSRFNEVQINVLKQNLDPQNVVRIMDVLDRHFISSDCIYTNPGILITMQPDVLDEELSLLEHLGCVSSTIGFVFKYLDKINIDKLRDLSTGPTDSIIKVLYDCVSEKESTNISEILELTPEETTVLEANLDAKEYNIFCSFPEVIKANYDTIRNLHVAEPARCITEHPKRFMNNPDVFDDILDKYDTPDLVRCINKNPAVIDKL